MLKLPRAMTIRTRTAKNIRRHPVDVARTYLYLPAATTRHVVGVGVSRGQTIGVMAVPALRPVTNTCLLNTAMTPIAKPPGL